MGSLNSQSQHAINTDFASGLLAINADSANGFPQFGDPRRHTDALKGHLREEGGRGRAAECGSQHRCVPTYPEEAYVAHGPRLCSLGLEPGWTAAIADWHRLSWFCVRGGTNAVTLRTGTRPGDPLADLVFALNLVTIQLEVLAALRSADLLHEVDVDAPSVFCPSGIVEVKEVSLPTFMDDMVVLVCCPDAADIVWRTAEAADIVTIVCLPTTA